MSNLGWIPAEVELLIWHFKVRRETQMITLTKVPQEPEKVCSGYEDDHPVYDAFCPKCGNELDKGDKVCHECGQRIDWSEDEESDT